MLHRSVQPQSSHRQIFAAGIIEKHILLEFLRREVDEDARKTARGSVNRTYIILYPCFCRTAVHKDTILQSEFFRVHKSPRSVAKREKILEALRRGIQQHSKQACRSSPSAEHSSHTRRLVGGRSISKLHALFQTARPEMREKADQQSNGSGICLQLRHKAIKMPRKAALQKTRPATAAPKSMQFPIARKNNKEYTQHTHLTYSMASGGRTHGGLTKQRACYEKGIPPP